MFDKLFSKGAEVLKGVAEKGTKVIEDAKEKGAEVLKGVAEKGTKVIEDAKEKGAEVLKNIKESNVAEALKDVAKAANKGIKKQERRYGSSKDMCCDDCGSYDDTMVNKINFECLCKKCRSLKTDASVIGHWLDRKTFLQRQTEILKERKKRAKREEERERESQKKQTTSNNGLSIEERRRLQEKQYNTERERAEQQRKREAAEKFRSSRDGDEHMLCGKCGLQIADDAVFCVGCGTYKHQQTDNKNPDDIILSAIKNNEPDIVISADDLEREVCNELVFRKKFLKKLIQLSGEVKNIRYTDEGYVVELGWKIYAFIHEASKSISELKGRDNITLKGFVEKIGYYDKEVHIKPCMILKDILNDKKDYIPVIEFQDFVYQIITNPIETRNSYYNKIIQIRGIVGGLEINSNRDFSIFLSHSEDDKFHVFNRFNFSDVNQYPKVASLKEGHQVCVKGICIGIGYKTTMLSKNRLDNLDSLDRMNFDIEIKVENCEIN